MSFYVFYEVGAAKTGFGMDADTPAAARTATHRNSPRRLIFFDGMEAPALTWC
jgi:hypothetical protein